MMKRSLTKREQRVQDPNVNFLLKINIKVAIFIDTEGGPVLLRTTESLFWCKLLVAVKRLKYGGHVGDA